MNSAVESSLLSKLQSSVDLADIYTLFSSYLHPFKPHLAPKKPSSRPPKTLETTTIRSLAKQFLPFLNNSISFLPKRLSSEAQATSPNKISRDSAFKLFDVYRLCLNCLHLVSSQLECKTYAIYLQQLRLVHCLEAWELYKEAETECFSVLDGLRGINSGKSGAKFKKLLLPRLDEEDADQLFAGLVVETVVRLTKCALVNQSKDGNDYKRVIALIHEATPWFDVLDGNAYEKWHKVLLGHISKIAVKLVEELEFFDLELVLEFCDVTFSVFKRSQDQVYKLALRICCCLFSKKSCQLSYIIGILNFVLSTLASDCKLNVDYTIMEFLEIVHYCAQRCQNASPAVCSAVAEQLNRLAGSQAIPLIGSTMALYSAGLLIFSFDCQSRIDESTTRRSTGFFLDDEEMLQQLPIYLDLMKEFFDIGGSRNGLSKKQISHVLCYCNVLKFLCQPFASFIVKERKEIFAVRNHAIFITNLKIIQDVFNQFCYICRQFCGTGANSNVSVNCSSDDNTKVITHVSVATFALSLKTGYHIKESENLVKYVASSDWIEADGFKYLFASLYNVAVVLYRNKQMKEASKALTLSCKASWNHVVYHCKSSEFRGDQSGHCFRAFVDGAMNLVNDTSEKTAFLLDLLFENNQCKINRQLKDSLEKWCIAEYMFKSLPPPLALVRRWVKIQNKLCKNLSEHSAPTLYCLLSSSVNVSERALGVLLEQELVAYKAKSAVDPRFCLKMRMKIIGILLEKIYISSDTYVQRSRILITKGEEYRELGIESLDECIQCLCDAILLLRDFCDRNSKYDGQALHLMACAYCLRALSAQEKIEANSKVLLLKSYFEDIHAAVNLWLHRHQSIASNHCNTLEDVLQLFHQKVHPLLSFESMLKLLYHVLDFLAIKGYMEIHADIYEIIIQLFKWKKLPLEEVLIMLWRSRRVGHAICASPISETLVSKLSQHYGKVSEFIGYWIKCMQPSHALLVGFKQRFFSTLPVSAQNSFEHESLEITDDEIKSVASDPTFHVSIEEVKLAASDLTSPVPESSTGCFLSAHLYYDLSERLIMQGQVVEALSYAREAYQCRTKLLREKFLYSVKNQAEINHENGDGTQRHCYSLENFQMHNLVATEAWNYGAPCDFESFVLTSWNILQCYLESTLQVANIHEILGEALEAEALLLWGKEIAIRQCLPLFVISFTSMLGKLYHKRMLWELAERELKAASQLMADNCNMISCSKCRMLLECTIYQQLGDLYKSHLCSNMTNPSFEMLSYAVEKYRSALHKLNNFEWDYSTGSFPDATGEQDEYRTRSSFFSCSIDPLDTIELPSKNELPDTKTQMKRPRKTKKDDKASSLHGQCLVAGHHLRMTRSRCRSLQKSGGSLSSSDQCGPPIKSNNDHLFASNVAPNQRGLLSEAKLSLDDFACEITRFCNKIKCWHCLALEALKSKSLTDFVHMNWDLVHRRSSLTLLISIGQCLGTYADDHNAHKIVLMSVSLLGNPSCPKYSSFSSMSLIDSINKDIQGDVFAVEHAMLLYNICRIAVKHYSFGFARENGCQLSCIGIPRIFSWLKLAFMLCCQVPLLSQKVSRLLTVLYMLSTSVEAFSMSPDEAVSQSHWATFFHQASIGSHFNQQLLSSMMRKPKVEGMMGLEDCSFSSSNFVSLSAISFLRLAPDSLEGLGKYVMRFFQELPCTTIICISVIGGADAILLRELLCCTSARAWILLSRLNSKSHPIFLVLPIESLLEEASFDISLQGEDFVSQWRCPWVYTVVDEIAPAFRSILRENYLSSASPKEDSTSNRVLWWSQRKRLDDCFGKFLQYLEDSWLGPWKYLLLGDCLDSKHVKSLGKNLMDSLLHKCKVNVDKDLAEVILGGALYSSEIRECGLQLIINKGCYIGGCCEALSNASTEVRRLSLEVFETILETGLALAETESLGRKPVTLVLDSAVQMLPWESLPILRNEEVYRMPSVGSICTTLARCHQYQDQLPEQGEAFPVIDPLDSFYVLNPSGDLSRTQVEFENWFRDQKFEGKTGTVPKSEELVGALKIYDLFIYIGHGSGSQYVNEHEIKKLNRCAATLLMGCCSGSLSMSGCYAPHGTPLCYLLAGSPVTVANLWEVTDKDIDRFGKAMLDAWLRERSVVSERCTRCDMLLDKFKSINIGETRGNGKERTRNKSPDSCVSVCSTCNRRPKIGSFMGQARKACNLPFLIGASPVCYGVPTGIAEKKRVVVLSP
ncbi:separase [Coffea eugenioides]|uniref:separase n=1 Tax=Coffea eugenioides TaxID=49369 RepID=UPI000F60F3C6|nr:separase [Coffea eugenioides]